MYSSNYFEGVTSAPDDNISASDTSDDENHENDGTAAPLVSKRKLKAYFRRRRTHNEQIIVRPCGIIISCATFFGSKAILAVHVCILFCPQQVFTIHL
jgi:hypothetical protein